MKKALFIFIAALVCMLLFACTSDAANNPPTEQPAAEIVPDASAEPEQAEDLDASTAQEATQDTEEATEEPASHQPDENLDTEHEASPATGEVDISFEYTRQSGPASNQHAVWIEDMDGNLIKSLFASQWTAKGGYRTRPDSIALWADRADLANMQQTDVDAVAGATPRTGPQSYTWDLTDLSGETVKKGDYIFFIEGTLRWKNFVLFSGVITLGDEPVTVQGEAVFHYEDSERYAALTDSSPENNMIGPVTAVFTP